MQSDASNTLVKLAKAVIEHAPEGGDAFWDIKFSDIEAALSVAEPVAWRIVGKLPSGSNTWKVVEHEQQAREEAKSWGKMCDVDVYPLYAAPPAPSVAVKALEWNPYRAETPFGWYQIEDQRSVPESELKGRPPFLLFGSRLDYSRHATLEEAKAASQADYEARILSALSAQVQDVAEDAERVKAAFNHGYVIACCNVANLHDEPGIAHDALRELGVTKAEVKRMGLCDYDAKALREIECARGPNSAFYAAAPAKQEGGTNE